MHENAFGSPNVWLLREDDHLVEIDDVQLIRDAPTDEWLDLGASDRFVWTISASPALGPNAKGNALARFDKVAARWDKVAGWGVSLDVDIDGNPWVLDSVGRLHSRGTRVPSVAFDEIVREQKAATETWDEYSFQKGLHLFPPVPPKPGYQSIYDEYVKPVTAQSALYLEMINRAREVGAAASVQLMSWDAYARMDPFQKQRYRSLVAALIDSSRGFELLFSFAPIFTKSLHIPPSVLAAKDVKDLGSSYFKAETVKSEYLKAVKELASIPGFKERVRYFSLGNEVDLFLTGLGSQAETDAVAAAYVDFCKAVAGPVRAILPRAKVGVCGTLRGLNDIPAFWDQILELSDVLICTYYAFGAGFQPLTPDLYKSEFPGVLFSRATTPKGKKPIVIQEIGMPTDPAIGGSEAFQADFLGYVLSKWDKAKNWIAYLSWWRLNDFHYDPALKVELANPADLNSPILVTQTGTSPSGAKFEPYLTFQGNPVLPYIGTGNTLSPNFDGPKRPGADPTEVGVNNKDVVYFVQQSVLPTSVPFCRCFSSCGLLRADGTSKESFGVYRNWTKARRVQQ